MKVLIVEDEKELSESIISYLRNEHYICELADNYRTALMKIDSFNYDCIILDISLPDGNGLNLLQELKDNHKAEGVIIISARNAIDDRIRGLNLGADDYLSKPFHLSELSARIAAIIRRRHFRGSNKIVVGDILVDADARQVFLKDQQIDLTKKEYQLLLYFIANKGRVISKNAIAEHLWGDDMNALDTYDFIYTHIKNLRKKLQEAGSPDYIKSIYAVGYKFSAG